MYENCTSADNFQSETSFLLEILFKDGATFQRICKIHFLSISPLIVSLHLSENENFEDEKTILKGCDNDVDCPQNLPQCNLMISPTISGHRGYCVKSSCQIDADCPSLGDECVTGRLGGRCDLASARCDYDKAVAIAQCLGKHSLIHFLKYDFFQGVDVIPHSK